MGYIGAGVTRFNTADELTVTGDAQIDGNTLVVDSTNNRVGVGTASPNNWNALTSNLVIEGASDSGITLDSGTASAGRIMFADGTTGNEQYRGYIVYNHNGDNIAIGTAGSERMRLDSSGRLGLGTTSPATSLHIQSGTQFDGIRLSKANGNRVVEINGLDSDNDEGNITLRLADTAKVQMRADGNSYFNGGNVGIGTSSPSGAQLHINRSAATGAYVRFQDSTGTAYVGTDSGNLQFLSGGATERMRIDSSGNVGIGTTSPTAKLMVNGGSANYPIVVNSTDQYAGIAFADNTTSGNSNVAVYADGNALGFEAGNAERMRITSGGNVVLNNASYLQFKDSGGTARDVLTIDAFNGLNINSAGGGSAAPIVFKANNTETMRIDTSLRLLVGTSSTSAPFDAGKIVINTTGDGMRIRSGGTPMRFIASGTSTFVGSITTTASSTAYNTSSDYRLKENVTDITGATERLKQLNPVRFNFIADADTTVDGFLAHEVQSVVPEAITGTKDAVDADGNPVYQGIDQSKLVPLLVKTIQELEARIAALEAN